MTKNALIGVLLKTIGHKMNNWKINFANRKHGYRNLLPCGALLRKLTFFYHFETSPRKTKKQSEYQENILLPKIL